MLRQIVTPLETSFTLQFPLDMVGKTVEIIAFELSETINVDEEKMAGKEERLSRIRSITKDSLVDLRGFKFNTDEANNYDE